MASSTSAFPQQRPSLYTPKPCLLLKLCVLAQTQTESKTVAYMCGCILTKTSVENRIGGFDNLKSRKALTSSMLSCQSISSTRDTVEDVQMAHQCGDARMDKALYLTQKMKLSGQVTSWKTCGRYPNLPRSARLVCAVDSAGCISSCNTFRKRAMELSPRWMQPM